MSKMYESIAAIQWERFADPDRPRCPFYGFVGFRKGFLVDSGENTCGLTFKCQECQFPTNGVPTWKGCQYQKQPDVIRFLETELDNFLVFPNELYPDDEGWNGVLLRKWLKMTQGHEAVR